jgi:flagellar protein FliS
MNEYVSTYRCLTANRWIMNQHARESYLESQVLTATPQKLRLMLIEAAIRFARMTLRHWEQGENEQALDTLIRCRNIISELLSSVRTDESKLTRQVAGLYLFVFKHLTEAQLRRDADCLQEAIEVLEIERETWRQVCEQMPEAPAPADQAASAPQEIIAPTEAINDGDYCGGSFSLDA